MATLPDITALVVLAQRLSQQSTIAKDEKKALDEAARRAEVELKAHLATLSAASGTTAGASVPQPQPHAQPQPQHPAAGIASPVGAQALALMDELKSEPLLKAKVRDEVGALVPGKVSVRIWLRRVASCIRPYQPTEKVTLSVLRALVPSKAQRRLEAAATWADGVRELCSLYDQPHEDAAALERVLELRQTGSVYAYYTEFVRLVEEAQDLASTVLPPAEQRMLFRRGLRPSLLAFVPMKPALEAIFAAATLAEANEAAEAKVSAVRVTQAPGRRRKTKRAGGGGGSEAARARPPQPSTRCPPKRSPRRSPDEPPIHAQGRHRQRPARRRRGLSDRR